MAELSRDHRATRLRFDPAMLLLAPALLTVIVFFVFPLADVAKRSLFDPAFTIAHFAKFLNEPLYSLIFLNTLQVAFITTAICAVLGYPAAYYLAHSRPSVRAYLIFLIVLPMWVSILIRSYAWMAVLGREGIINSALIGMGLIDAPLKMLYTTGAVYLAMVQIMMPIMILTCYGVMRGVPEDLIKAARVLGAGRKSAFLHVYFPLSLGGVRNGSIIIFILSLGYFITPELVGGRQDMMIGNLIVFQIDKLANWGFASAIGIVLISQALLAQNRTSPTVEE